MTRLAVALACALVGCAAHNARESVADASRLARAISSSGQSVFASSCRRVAYRCAASGDKTCGPLKQCQAKMNDFVVLCSIALNAVDLAQAALDAGRVDRARALLVYVDNLTRELFRVVEGMAEK